MVDIEELKTKYPETYEVVIKVVVPYTKSVKATFVQKLLGQANFLGLVEQTLTWEEQECLYVEDGYHLNYSQPFWSICEKMLTERDKFVLVEDFILTDINTGVNFILNKNDYSLSKVEGYKVFNPFEEHILSMVIFQLVFELKSSEIAYVFSDDRQKLTDLYKEK